MRKQTRPVQPQVFREHSETWNAQWSALREQNPRAAFSWYEIDSKSARDWALPDLKEMNQGHCSFCDNFPLDKGDEPIEHLRPKTNCAFYHLAYSWENLYYCCTTCNGFKNEKFDDKVLAPDEIGYDPLDFFYFDSTNGTISPNPAANDECKERAQITIELFGLDRGERDKMRRLEIQKWAGQSSESDLTIDEYAYRDFLDERELSV